MMAMTRSAFNKYKSLLEAKQDELSVDLRSRDEIAIEKTPDAIDEGVFSAERELAISNLDRDTTLLREVQDALIRLAEGSYGICLRCDQEITTERLDAVPWAKHCVECQENADRNTVPEPPVA